MVTVPKDAVEGLITETFAYTELNRLYQAPVGRRKVRGDKPCFSTCGDYELDFVVVDHDDIKIRIEAKSSNNKAKSLEFYEDRGMIDKGFKAAPIVGRHGERFDTIPIYLAGLGFPYVGE